MDENEELAALTAMSSTTDQHAALARSIAQAVVAYYRALVEGTLPPALAAELAAVFNRRVTMSIWGNTEDVEAETP